MKPALAADRALRVLNYFTVNPRSTFTLSELSAALQVSHASMSSVLLALTENGYLVRHPRHKTYDLGPMAMASGQAASMRYPVVELAKPWMPDLAALGTECIGMALVGDQMVVLDIEGQASLASREVRLGQRLPLIPPYGHVFLAWSQPRAVQKWLAALGPDQARLREAEFERSLAFTRTNGFAVALDNERVAGVQQMFGELARRPWDQETRSRISARIPEQSDEYALAELDPDREYTIDHVSAPVFEPNGTVGYALTINGIGTSSGERIAAIGRELSAVCLTLTRNLGGRAPIS
ncbi:MAG: hypothetical protein JWO98_2181 [Frankiales bacterium]|nr:hypothetical protein [Frankiales bacterium]